MPRVYTAPAAQYFAASTAEDMELLGLPTLTSWRSLIKKSDTPGEWVGIFQTPLDQPARASYKFETVNNIYNSFKFIDDSARVTNTTGVRTSFAYSEVGKITDSRDASWEKLIPNTITINLTQSVVDDMSETARADFIARAFTMFLGHTLESGGSIDPADTLTDVIRRLYGVLEPTGLD